MKGVIKEVGQYIVAEMIGEGSFGKVYKGINRFDKSEVALKFISKKNKNKKELEGLRSQNEMLKNINHKNIIKLLDFLETPNEMIIITQYAGQNLSNVLERKVKFTYQEVKGYCKQIFDALCYLDDNRIAHRDLKPQNILIQNQVIKICDFGFARKLSASTNYMNSLKGTPLYIAPEILASGPLNYTKKVDIWSFGVITYELFTGKPPFYAQDLHRLKPKILYDKVKFPKQMPLQLRTVIDKMLQKNPESRADWQQLKKYQFFNQKIQQPLSQKSQNIPKIEAIKQDQIQLIKQQSDKEPIPDKKAKIYRLTSNQDIQQMKKIEADLMGGKIDAKKMRTDTAFCEKALSIFSSFFSGEEIVTKQMLNPITSIMLYLMTKVKPNDVDSTLDIVRKKQWLFCAIKLAEQDTQPDTLSNQLVLIGFLIKNNFDNVSIDFQTDQDILEICLRQIQANRSASCFGNALTVLGTLASQGILTLNGSQQFFIKIQKQEVLVSVAQAYQPIPSRRIVLQCIEKFIHPNHSPGIVSKNQQQLRKAFIGMKHQVAKTLLQKNFLIYNPLTIFKEPQYVQSYAKILYECINVSQSFRKQFLRNTFWIDFLQHKNLRIFCFAYDYICIQKDKICLIPNEVMKGVTTAQNNKKNSLMENAFYLARAEFYLSKKQIQTSSKQQSTMKLINQVFQSLSVDEQAKKKASRQVEGFLFMEHRIYEQVFGQTFCNIFNDPLFDKSVISENVIQIILENILNTKPQDELRVSTWTAARALICIEEFFRAQNSAVRQNKKILGILASTVNFFLDNSIIYQIQSEYGLIFTKKLLFAIFNIIKIYSIVDQKQQFDLYCKIEQKNIHSMLISQNMIDKNTLAICLLILQKLSSPQSKYTNQIIDFMGLNLIDKLKNFLNLDLEDKDSQIIVQILHMLSLLIKKNQEYAAKLKKLEIISHFPRYLQHPTNENIRHQTLTLIGNMAKHSTYFFEDFSVNGVFPTVVDTVKRFGYGSKSKILKGIVYAVGNISFYSDKFCKDFTQLIPSFYAALAIDDPYLVANTMSTISNLLRHSNCYLKALIHNKIVKRVIQIVMDSTKAQNKLMFGLNMIKKVLSYPQIFEDHPKSEFIQIYKQKCRLVGQENDCMKKIKTLM